MRAMTKVDGRWLRQTPSDLYLWLCSNDGEDAVVIDDASKTYYCSRIEMLDSYRDAWAKEGKAKDERKAAMFSGLCFRLFSDDVVGPSDKSAVWCGSEGVLCSEVADCGGSCLFDAP